MRKLLRDGIAVAFDDQGHGDPAIVCVHGWCCDHTHFDAQVQYFRGSHRVVTLDLRGHGDSDKPVQRYHPDDHAADLAWLIESLELDRPILVGHSMGGVVVLRYSDLYPGTYRALIGLDSAWGRLEPTLLSAAASILKSLQQPNYRDVLRHVFEGLFLDSDNPVTKDRIITAAVAMRQDVMVSEWEAVDTDTSEALKHISTPALYIAAEFPRADLEYLRSLGTVTVGQTIGSGHFNQIECADQVNAMVDQFLRVNGVQPLADRRAE